MKIGILSASSHLGHHELDTLLKLGVPAEDIVACVRTPSRLDSYRAKGLEVRHADYNDPGTLVNAFTGVDRLHLIPTFDTSRIRVQQVENAIDAARNSNVRHLVLTGFIATEVTSPFLVTPYLLYAESAVRTSGLAWTILRDGLYADPILDWLPSILAMGTIPYPTLEGRCAFVSRFDLGRATAAVLATEGHDGNVYRLTGQKALRNADLCDAIARISGTKVEDRNSQDQDYINVCRHEGEPESMIGLMLSMYWAIREGHMDIVTHDIERLTGTPPKNFEDLVSERLNGGEQA